MKKNRTGIFIACMASAALAAGAFFAQKEAAGAGNAATKDMYLLDTFCTITIYGEGGGALDGAAGLLKEYDRLFDPEREDSDIYRINHRDSGEGAQAAEDEPVMIDRDTALMLMGAQEISELSGGALWPAIRPVTELWDFRGEGRLPDEDTLASALSISQNSVWHIEGNDTDGYSFIGPPSVKIEAGAFAKGYIADRLKEYLEENNVVSAIIDLGGNVQTVGKNPDGRGFRIGVKDPAGEKAYLEVLEVSGLSVVTAGSYERCFELDGKIYHHILDPDTGYPADNGLSSVTVSGPSSFVCDALSTACFVRGREDGLKLIEGYNRLEGTDYAVIFH